MATLVFVIGAVVASALLGLLVLTLLWPHLRIWPTPGPKTWQSYVFWPLFRFLNVICFVAAAATFSEHPQLLGLPTWLRLLAFGLLVASVAIFVYSFRILGRDNSYGAQNGLVTGGIYRWSRNPQNAMLILVYGCLALAADTAATYVLCAAMMTAYTLMVMTEEPWLVAIYGEPYRRYCADVPRFFNWHRAAALAREQIARR